MEDAPDEVVERVEVRAPASEVWDAVVDGVRRGRWWSHLELEPVAGGRLVERWTASTGRTVTTTGAVLELVPERLLRLSWRDDDWPAPTTVELTLTPSPLGTTATVRHAGWGALPDPAGLATAHGEGWRAHLQALRRHVEEHDPVR